MRNVTQALFGRNVRIAGAALLAGSLAAFGPAPRPAPAVPAAPADMACDPQVDQCMRLYIYYSSSAKTTEVGHATRDCDGVYTLDDGYATAYVTIHYVFCPY